MDIKNNIIKPVLYTFLAMLFLLIAIFSVLHFFYPLTLSNWFYSMGANQLAVDYLERSYEKTKEYSQLYSLINLSIKTNSYEKIEKYYEVFSEDEKYSEFVTKVDINNATKKTNNLVKATMYSEDNYLKNKYVLALVKLNKIDKAFDYAMQNTNFDITTEIIGNYVFTNIFNIEVEFDSVCTDNSINTKIEKCFEDSITAFNSYVNKEDLDTASKITALVLGRRVNEIGRNLKAIKDFNPELVSLSDEDINLKILDVSKNMTLFV